MAEGEGPAGQVAEQGSGFVAWTGFELVSVRRDAEEEAAEEMRGLLRRSHAGA